MNIQHLFKMKQQGQKISMVTCYDYWSAKIISSTSIDAVLVGDSVAMTTHGSDSTLPTTVELMAMHTQWVHRGLNQKKLLIADLPFMSYRGSRQTSIDAVTTLMQAGAQAVKLEGADGNLELIQHIVQSGVPVMGHLGLTPQSVHQLGGYKVQARDSVMAQKLIKDAKALEEAGCFSVVLECIPSNLAAQVSQELTIPTIGIGAGIETDGQILVLHDLLGLNPDFKPKFVRQYLSGFELIKQALNQYSTSVQEQTFPSVNEAFE